MKTGVNFLFMYIFSEKHFSKKEAIWITLVGLFVHVVIKYWDFLTLEGTFITPTFRVGVMKVPSVSLILPYFMGFFRFCHFLKQSWTLDEPKYARFFKKNRLCHYTKVCILGVTLGSLHNYSGRFVLCNPKLWFVEKAT